jgi:hypothetical protein
LDRIASIAAGTGPAIPSVAARIEAMRSPGSTSIGAERVCTAM